MFIVNDREYLCPLQLSMSLISGKWKGVIIWFLLMNKILRFGQLKKRINENSTKHITDKMLIQSLRELEQDGLIKRKVYAVVPPKVEYSLSKKGLQLKPIIKSLEAFGCLFESSVKK